ncbi:hypothetical protein EV356DRAFT_161479 [Viridothelium virens]|uniref:Uncharacterized protein n=1 Tax=Viridothelium virens TaxID=1048519 RepID=A0A6A6HM40_VIRVR|nr:hypothetical protein EV356DRAFT_161479 [Viridothelium virens]
MDSPRLGVLGFCLPRHLTNFRSQALINAKRDKALAEPMRAVLRVGASIFALKLVGERLQGAYQCLLRKVSRSNFAYPAHTCDLADASERYLLRSLRFMNILIHQITKVMV